MTCSEHEPVEVEVTIGSTTVAVGSEPGVNDEGDACLLVSLRQQARNGEWSSPGKVVPILPVIELMPDVYFGGP
ncbi:hypothetical protein ACFLZP_02865 [Patescibacteria group bacterium]